MSVCVSVMIPEIWLFRTPPEHLFPQVYFERNTNSQRTSLLNLTMVGLSILIQTIMKDYLSSLTFIAFFFHAF